MSKKITSWPSELDALNADPGHHTLLLENEFVRVLDTCVRPGEMTEIHTHEYSATLYIKSWSDFIRYDDAGNEVFDSRKLKNPPKPLSAIWAGPLPPHRLKNIGTQDFHAIAVEIKKT